MMKMKMKHTLSGSVVMALLIINYALAGDGSTVALITKTVQVVDKKSPQVNWRKAAPSDPLSSGDGVRTGQRSLAIVKFIDNSIVRVRELSELTITGETNIPGALSKSIRLSKGAFGFDVKKQQNNEQFRMTSPTSVASIRGTKGKMSGSNGRDTLVVTEGIVNFKNSPSGKDIDVRAGYIGFSNKDGILLSREATEAELADATNAATGGSLNELNLQLKDSHGNKKELKLKFKR